jgi:hypothetical protein
MVIKYLPLYLKYSSWKDLNYLLPTLVFGEIINLWAKQLIVDIDSSTPSFAAKWIPSEGSNIDKSYKITAKLIKKMGISRKELRKKYLTPLRSKLDIVESYITNKNYGSINYKTMPRRARCRYHKTFLANDGDRYLEYLSSTSWLWLPSNYWNKDQLPDNGIIGINQTKIGKILVVIDGSSVVDKTSLGIAYSLARKLSRKHVVDVAPFSEQPEIVNLDDPSRLIKIIENFNSTLSCRLDVDGYDRIIVLTSPMNYVSINTDNTIWWSIYHEPPTFGEINNILYIKGYSLTLFERLVDDIIKFTMEEYLSVMFKKIELGP